LLFSIGFKGGQELSHSSMSAEIFNSLLLGLALASVIPLYSFFILKRRLSISDAGAVSAAYGSVSAVTFVAAMAFLESVNRQAGGHMVAVMALMEAPAIIVGVVLIRHFTPIESSPAEGVKKIIGHALTNGSVLMVLGSLLIGMVADAKQAEGIRPFTTDIFKGFLAIFLLEMGMVTARRFSAFRRYGGFVTAFAVIVPVVNGCVAAIVSAGVTHDVANRLIFAVLAGSASYIAVPAAMKLAAPESDPGLYLPMALGVTFPFNISIGIPLYYALVQIT